jgi:hypothetical protein
MYILLHCHFSTVIVREPKNVPTTATWPKPLAASYYRKSLIWTTRNRDPFRALQISDSGATTDSVGITTWWQQAGAHVSLEIGGNLGTTDWWHRVTTLQYHSVSIFSV